MRVITKHRILLVAVFVLTTLINPVYARKYKTIPDDSPRLSGTVSDYSLADPRVALKKIEAIEVKKDTSTVNSLIHAYHENATRPDGYGPSIQLTILKTLAGLKSKKSLAFLQNEFNTLTDAHYKDEIAIAFGAIGDAAALADLKNYRLVLQTKEPADPLIHHQWQDYIQHVDEAILKIELSK